MRTRWAAAGAVVALAASTLAGQAAVQAATSKPKGHVLLVCSGTAGCPKGGHYFRTIQSAVDRAVDGDWVLVWPGVYKESVTVQPGRGLAKGLHIRGMQRAGVLLEGKGQSGSGVHVQGVDQTWVENMTAQHYHAGSANGFYWTSVDGYWGNYLTAYDNGDYGVYAYDSTCSGATPCTFAFDYGSWNADSGIYIGGCRDCHAVITNSKAEKNAIGYSGTNAGGELYLVNSEWDHNGSGIVPNTLYSEPDPPQDAVTIVGNYVHDNNDTDVPGTGITAIAPVGNGIEIAGGWNDIIRDNVIVNQAHAGVLLHWLFTPPYNTQVLNNRFKHVGYAGSPGDADISIGGSSVQTCVYRNVDVTSGKAVPASTDPPSFAATNSCGSDNPTRQLGRGVYPPGDPVVSIMTALNAAGITEPKDFKGPGPHPEAQRTMANPCAGVPDNAWCSSGKPVFRAPSRPTR